MACHCCGPTALGPQPAAGSIVVAPIEERGCQDSCCDSGHGDAEPLETEDPGQKKSNDEKPADSCCAAGECTDNEVENDTNVPDCCRGKVKCCDASCLDRLAMRECEMSKYSL